MLDNRAMSQRVCRTTHLAHHSKDAHEVQGSAYRSKVIYCETPKSCPKMVGLLSMSKIIRYEFMGSRLVTIPNAVHDTTYDAASGLYQEAVLNFLDSNFPK